MLGAVDNTPQLKRLPNLDGIIRGIMNMPEKEGLKSADEMKTALPFQGSLSLASKSEAGGNTPGEVVVCMCGFVWR